MRELKITPDVAKALVDAGTPKNYKSTQKTKNKPAPFYDNRVDVRPAKICRSWSRNDAGLWYTNAHFIIGNAVDYSFTFRVFAPLACEHTEEPTTASAKVSVVWRDRWELVDLPQPLLVKQADDETFSETRRIIFEGHMNVGQTESGDALRVWCSTGTRGFSLNAFPAPVSQATNYPAGYIPFDSSHFALAENPLTNAKALQIKAPSLLYTEDSDVANKGDAITQIMTGGRVSYINGSYIFIPTFTPIKVGFGG